MDLPSFTTQILSRKEQINWQDLHLFNTRYTWPETHVRFSWFILLSLLNWATETAPLNHSSITTNKSRWYLPSLSHKPVKTCFFLICTPGSFQPTMALLPHPGILSYVTCGNVPIQRASIMLNGISIQSGHNTCKNGNNRQLLTLLSCSFTTYNHSTPE